MRNGNRDFVQREFDFIAVCVIAYIREGKKRRTEPAKLYVFVTIDCGIWMLKASRQQPQSN